MIHSKFPRLAVAGAAAVILSLASVSLADSDTIALHTGAGFYSAGNGGEFKAVGYDGTIHAMGAGVQVASDTFQTFCMERSETFSPGAAYHYSIDVKAIGGGGDDEPDEATSDFLDARTAYLYTEFWNGTLSWENGGTQYYDYVQGAGRVASALALQQVIWYIEDELAIGALNADALALLTKANAAVASGGSGSWYNAHNDGSEATIGNVRVLNLWTNAAHTGVVQSQLIMVPIPSSLLYGFAGGLIGLGFLGFKRRRPSAV